MAAPREPAEKPSDSPRRGVSAALARLAAGMLRGLLIPVRSAIGRGMGPWTRGLAERGRAVVAAVRPTVRLRLALLTGGLAMVAGATVLGLTYFLLNKPLHAVRLFFACRGTTCPPALPYPPPGVVPPLIRAAVQGALAVARERLRSPLTAGHLPDVLFLARAVSDTQHAADLRQFLLEGALALAVLAVLSAVAGWWVAGRVLQPLQLMTRRVRELSGQTPLGRIRLAGPEDEMKSLGDTFDGLLDRLDAALATERRFVANASHELRTPLAIQETLLEVGLADPAADADTLREMAGRLRQVNRRSRRLIDGLLALARSQQGLGRAETVDLAAVVRDAVDTLAAEPAARTLRIEQHLQPAPVWGDPVLLERLAGNLVENAVRYNVNGGRVQIRTAAADRRAVLMVANSGPHLAGEDVERLFEPFRRGVRDRTDSRRGAGLGLSIVRAVAAAHGGTAAAEARPEGGLVVTVTLPQSERPEAPPDPP